MLTTGLPATTRWLCTQRQPFHVDYRLACHHTLVVHPLLSRMPLFFVCVFILRYTC